MRVLLLALSVIVSLSSFSQRRIDFNKCETSYEPAICSAKLLALKIEELKGHLHVPAVISGVYNYEKGFNKEQIGRRRIVSQGSNVKYFGSNGELYTTFQCLPGKQVCRSTDGARHMLVIMGNNEFFIDWNDDSNGHYKWVAHNKRPH